MPLIYANPAPAPGAAGGPPAARLVEVVRATLARDASIRSVLSKHPEAIRSAADPAAIKTGWLPKAQPTHVLVFSEYGIGDPYTYPSVHKAFERTAQALRELPGVENAGWESINAGVQYFWVKPATRVSTSSKQGELFARRGAADDDGAVPEFSSRGVAITSKGQWMRILAGMERAIWVTAYADWAEEAPASTQRRLQASGLMPARGQDWCDVAPAAPRPDTMQAAKELVRLFEEVNGRSLEELATMAQRAHQPPTGWLLGNADAELFGHYLAMQALGHGVSWFDDHPAFPLKFPLHFEARTPDGRRLTYSGRAR